MNDPLARLARLLLESDEGATPFCRACENDLAAYVEAELAGDDAAARLPAAATHLASCASCAAAYAELRSLFAAEQAGAFEQPPVPLAIDYGYLERHTPIVEEAPAVEAPKPWRLDELGRLLIQFSVDLLARLAPSPALQPSYLKGATAGLIYSLTGEIPDLDATVRVTPSRGDASSVTVTVEVDVPSRDGWPNLGGTVVRLLRGGEELDTQETDAFGRAVFERVPMEALAELVVEIQAARAT